MLVEVQSPIFAIGTKILFELRALKDEDGELMVPFMALPDRTDFADYYQLISNPIAANTIYEHLFANHYSRLGQLQQDLLTLFRNARIYNEMESAVHLLFVLTLTDLML